MKKYQNLSIIAMAAILTACGGGGGGGSNDSGSSNQPSTEQPGTPNGGSGGNNSGNTPNYTDNNRSTIFDLINANRTTCGFNAVVQNSMLDTAAQGHAAYSQANKVASHSQNPANPGFTGATQLDRLLACGYSVKSAGEILAGLYGGTLFAGTDQNGIDTSDAAPTGVAITKRLFSTVYHLSGAVDDMNDVGVGYSVSSNLSGVPEKTNYYATAVANFATAQGATSQPYSGTEVRSFPCSGITNVSPVFRAESPNPFPGRDLDAAPMGTPIIFKSNQGGAISLTSYIVKEAVTGKMLGATHLDTTNDPNKTIRQNEVFVVPISPLKPMTRYNVEVTGVSDSIAFSKAFDFVTGTQN